MEAAAQTTFVEPKKQLIREFPLQNVGLSSCNVPVPRMINLYEINDQ